MHWTPLRGRLLVAAPLILAGCAILEPSREAEREQLRRAASIWEDRGWRDYTYVMERLCFCGYGGVPVQVTVRDGGRVSAIAIETGEPLPMEIAQLYYTVPEMFEFLEEALRRDPASFRAVYDEQTGHPLEAWIDYARNTADEEQGFEVRELRPIEE